MSDNSKPAKVPAQQQIPPGTISQLKPQADHGEESYVGSGKLQGKIALITGGDSGIGRAVAIAYAREGADIVLSYLNKHDDARSTAEWIEKAGRKVIVVAGDITDEAHCKALIETAVKQLGGLDILDNNAAFQRTYDDIGDITADEWDTTFCTNIYAPFFLSKAAVRI